MKLLKILVVVLSMTLLVSCLLTSSLNHQESIILENPTESENCIRNSTYNFRKGNKTTKRYFLYRCQLKPDIRSLIFYYDPETKKVISSMSVDTSFDDLYYPSKYCVFGMSKNEPNIVFERCVFDIAYDDRLGNRVEKLFSTPIQKSTNDDVIKEIKYRHHYNINNINDFDTQY